MANKRTLTIEVVGDASGAGKAFKEVETKSSGMGSILQGVGQALGGGLASIGGKALEMIPGILEAGGKLDALGKKAATVFGDSLKDVEAWGKANAKAMGLTTKEAVGMAAGVGDLLKPMGFTSEQAGKMSTDMLNLSGALSAWSGNTKSAAEVSDIMTSALLGETDGLKALGISISGADIDAKLAANGQKDLTGAALEQAKALAIQQLIMEKSTDAQTAWTDGSMDALKAQNESKAGIATLKETLVTTLFPALQKLVPYIAKAAEWLGVQLPIAIKAVVAWFKDNLLPIIMKVGDFFGFLVGWVQEHWDEISAVIETAVIIVKGIINGLITGVTAAWDMFGGTLLTALSAVWDAIKGIVQAAIDVVVGIIKTVIAIFTGDWGAAWDGIKQILFGVWEAIKTVVQAAIDYVQLILGLAWDAIGGTVTKVWDTIKGILSGVWDGIKSVASSAWDSIKDAIMVPVNLVKWYIETWVTAVKLILSTAWDAIKSVATGAWDGLKAVATGAWDGIKAVIMAPINALTGAMSAVWDGIKGTLSTVWDTIKTQVVDKVVAVADVILGLPGKIAGLAGSLLTKGKEFGEAFLDGLMNGLKAVAGFAGDVAAGIVRVFKEAWNTVARMVNNFVPDSIGWGPFTLDLPDNPIPTFHSGGLVPGGPNSQMLALLAGGETVRTASQEAAMGGSAGSTVVVYLTVAGSVTSEQDLVRAVYDGIIDGQRRGELVGSL